MKSSTLIKSVLLPGLVASTVFLASCGGGSSDSDSSVNSRGLITGFGSVYVNGVKYDTDSAQFDVDDDNSATQAALSVGQFVTVTGSIDANGTTGQASRISYENELQGPIKNKTPDPVDLTGETGTMEVLGRLVTVNANTNIDDGLTFVDLVDGNFVEISGFNTDSGITASYIELQNDSEVEIVGEIAMLDEVSGTFEIYGFTIAYDGNTDLEDDITLADGLYVEAKGELDPIDDTVLIAAEIEAEDDGKGEDDDEVEIQGIVSNYDPAAMTFNLGIIQVDASNNPEMSPSSLDLSVADLEVEVEGYWLNGVLIADEIEQKGQKIKIDAPLSDVDTAGTVTFTFNGSDVVVRVNQQTELEDDLSSAPLTLSGLSIDDYVEMEAFNDGSGDINAVKLKRKTLGEIEIEAPVDSFDEAGETVTLLGISFNLGLSDFEDYNDLPISAIQFYAALRVGVFVELTDIGNDGVIDKAELDD